MTHKHTFSDKFVDAGSWHETLGSEINDYHSHSSKQHEHQHVWHCLPSPWFLQGLVKRNRWFLHTQWVMMQARKSEFKETEYFIYLLSIAPNSTLSICQSCSLYKHSQKDSLDQRQTVPLLAKHAEMWQTCGELFSNIPEVTVSLLYGMASHMFLF